jgi:DNA/RNA non-specific endonuclease
MQVGAGFNRDYWARFEKLVKDVTRRAADVYVVTGPVFAPALTPQGLVAYHGYIGVVCPMSAASLTVLMLLRCSTPV